MILHDIQIRNFGRLQNFSFQPAAGFQLIYGANEQGKSTLMAFIRAMLYGFSSDGRKLETSERQRYLPWDGNDMGGTLVFSHQEHRWRLERSFGSRKSADRTSLMDDISGEAVTVRHDDMPGFDLLGISEQEFVNTVFVRQMGSLVSENGDLLTRLSNLAGSGSAQTSVAEVAQRLRQAETDLQPLRGSGGRIQVLELELENLRFQREQAIQNAEQLIEQHRQLHQLQDEQRQQNCQISKQRTALEQQKILRRLERWQQIDKAHQRLQSLNDEHAQITGSLIFAGQLTTGDDIANLEKLQAHWLDAQRRRDSLNKQLDQLRLRLADHQSEQPDQALITMNRAQLREQRTAAQQITRQAEQAAHQLSQAEALAETCRENRQELQVRSQAIQRVKSQHQDYLQRLESEKAAASRELFEHDTERQQLSDSIARKQALLQQAVASQTNISSTGWSGRQLFLLITSVILAAAAAGIALFLQLGLIWLAVPVLLLPILILLIRKQQQLNHDKQTRQQQRTVIESQLSLQQGQLESSRRLHSAAERSVRDFENRIQDENNRFAERLQSLELDYRMIEEKIDGASDRLNQLLSELDASLLEADHAPADLTEDALISFQIDHLRDQQRYLNEAAARQQATLNHILTQTGCADWDQLEESLQSADQYLGELSGIQQQIQLSEPLLAEAETACAQTGEAVIQQLRVYRPGADDAGEVQDVILSLREQQQKLQSVNAQIGPAQQFFNDLLDQRSFESWQQFSVSEAAAVNGLDRLPDETLAQMDQVLNEQLNEQLQLQSRLSSLEAEIRQASQQQIAVRDLDDEITLKAATLARMHQYADWLRQARKALDQAADELQKSFGPALNQQTGQILKHLTGGQYDDIRVDRSFGIRFADQDQRFHEWLYLSGGTADQVYLALRLAISDQITDSDSPLPLLLDDILIQYDDQRAFAALSALIERAAARGQQMLLLTCQKRYHDQVAEKKLPLLSLNS